MADTTRELILDRPWAEVDAEVARDRVARYRQTGAASSAEALWAAECELRRGPGYRRARELDLEHHIGWRRLLDELACTR